MPSGIIKGSAMSCCSLGIRTFVARGLCSAASDWVGSCVITTAKRRERVGESPDEFFDHTGDVYRWAASNWRRGSDADQRSHEWRDLPGLHRAMFGPNAQAQGHCGGR